MSSIINLSDLYNQVVELKKEKLELSFLPVSDRSKNHASKMRKLRADLSKLKREMNAVKKSKQQSINVIKEAVATKEKE